MHRVKSVIAAGVAAVVLCSTGGAWAHGKVGLWNVSVTMKTSAMPDISKMSPQVQAQMRAMGLFNGKGMTISDQHCMTAAEVARTDFNPGADQNKSCKLTNQKNSSGSMSADMTCNGDFNGTGHVQFSFDGDTHYSGHMTMTGTHDGKPVSTDMVFDGKWLKGDCGKVKT